MMQALETISIEGDTATGKGAFQLHSAACKSSFIMAMILIAKYSAMVELVVNALQFKTLNIVKTSQHIQHIVKMVRSHRKDEEKITDEVLKEANQIAEQLGLDMNIPRIVGRQQHRSNHPATNSTKFWRRSLIIPYLDSITSSLELRFSTENKPAYALTYLHPLHILLITIDELKEKTASFYSFYHLEGIEKELELWYKIWKDKKLSSC